MSIEENNATKRVVSSCKSQFVDIDDKPSDSSCLLCDKLFILPTNEQEFLSHLFNEHRLVIGDVKEIASLKSYIRYWRVKFKEEPLTTYCTTLTDSKKVSKPLSDESAQSDFYFFLSDCLMEDKTLRYELRRAKLEWVLSEQLKERNDKTFKRGCIFCKTNFVGSRVEYLNHLCVKHNIFLGKLEDIVFIDEYLDKIQDNIEKFICLYCEKHFKDRVVLKEHMRKKLHKQINPNNKEYDKYYVVNYTLERCSKKNSKIQNNDEIESAVSDEGSGNEDEDWSDWKNESQTITCLFCNQISRDFPDILQHMKSDHKFDFEKITEKFTFYQKVKLVNYIRKQMDSNKCMYCDVTIEHDALHMKESDHYKIPAKEIWDQPVFYFPMFESDSFLYSLDTSSDEELS